jgi:CheY-like chemotaxis protein
VSQDAGAAGRPLKVLHVDDDPLNLRVVQEILSAFGHTTVSVSNGVEALARLGSERFDAALLDIHMPGMTGIEVLQTLRRSGGPERDLPAIALTADIVSRRPADYLTLGFTDYISKPILISGLMAALYRATAPSDPERLRRAG